MTPLSFPSIPSSLSLSSLLCVSDQMDWRDHDANRQVISREPPTDVTSYDLGIGRSYECVFCKRGFTTAQALGGHMNIHRKDRAKPRLNPSSSSSLNHESNNNLGFPSQVDFHQFLTPTNSSSSSNPRFHTDAATQIGSLSACCKENWCSTASLGLHIGVVPSSHIVEEIGKKRSSQGGFDIHHQAVEELDLELRLGHHSP